MSWVGFWGVHGGLGFAVVGVGDRVREKGRVGKRKVFRRWLARGAARGLPGKTRMAEKQFSWSGRRPKADIELLFKKLAFMERMC